MIESHSVLPLIVAFLGAICFFVPLTKAIGVGSVPGYLVAGVLLGPHGFNVFANPETVFSFSEIGVVFLLFLIGLELNPRRLWDLRRKLVGLGVGQIALSGVTLGIALFALGFGYAEVLVCALGLSLSSTAISVHELRERGLFNRPAGEGAFSVLLLQDLAVVPILALVPILGAARESGSAHTPSGWMSLSAVFLILIGGRYAARPVFRHIARTKVREVFTAFSLFLVLGIAVFAHHAGLSMALGAFLAGVVLADSEYRHELEVDLDPFKGLLLGLFFAAVGMAIPLPRIAEAPAFFLLAVLLFVAVKGLSLWGLARLCGLGRADATVFSMALGQGGEFAFVLFNTAVTYQVLTRERADDLITTVVLSMILTPIVFQVHTLLERRAIRQGRFSSQDQEPIERQERAVILAGFGRFGGMVGRVLAGKQIPMTVIDHDPNQIELIRKFGNKAYYGDVTRLDVLQAAGAADARLLVLAIDDMEATEKTLALVATNFPHLPVLVRARNRQSAGKFLRAGWSRVVRETFESSLEMAELALRELGVRKYDARRIVHHFRMHDRDLLHRGLQHAGDQKMLITLSKQGREDFERLLTEDEQVRGTGDRWE